MKAYEYTQRQLNMPPWRRETAAARDVGSTQKVWLRLQWRMRMKTVIDDGK